MSDPSAVVSLVPGKTDQQLAAEYRGELTPVLTKAAEIIDRARASGLSINFNISPDTHGRIVLKEMLVVKPL